MNEAELQGKIFNTFMRAGSPWTSLDAEAVDELAFHLTDWLADLEKLVTLYNSERWDPEQAEDIILGFLIHASNHVPAAHRILMDKPATDVFQLGAVQGTGQPRRKPGEPYPDEPPPGNP
ncbi:MAG TPA: hypothetical protein VD997_10390 [Phycisphaerales bacterium]|nr:hypothetical protein [Phycisphaerales bacterium]